LDVERAERVEADLDRLITRRHDQRVKDEGERQAEEAWAESERRHFAKRRERNRIAWIGYFECIATALRVRAEEYDARAEKLMEAKGQEDA
jgi:hypothetical protein